VPEYRLYTLGTDGHFANVKVIECANDQEAIKQSRQLIDGHDLELWHYDRYIARLSPHSSHSPE